MPTWPKSNLEPDSFPVRVQVSGANTTTAFVIPSGYLLIIEGADFTAENVAPSDVTFDIFVVPNRFFANVQTIGGAENVYASYRGGAIALEGETVQVTMTADFGGTTMQGQLWGTLVAARTVVL